MSLLTNLVSYWKLDEASGTRNDSHGTNHLSDNNTVASTTGKINNGALFVVTNSEYLSCASNASLQMSGNTDFTITAWVKINSNPGGFDDYCIVTKDDDAANSRDYTLDYQNTQGFRFYIKGGATYLAKVNAATTIGEWNFVVAWYDSSNGQLHLRINDTTTYNSVTGATGTDVSSAQFRIGAREYAGAENYADAVIDEVGLWKRILTADEQTRLYGSPNHPSNPIISLQASSWYESQIYDFNVMTNPADSTQLLMYASGMASPASTGTESIGLFTANATNPFTWTDQGQVLTVGTGWENGAQGIRIGSMVYDSGTYYLYYNTDVTSPAPGSGSIGLATSNNGTTFSKSVSNPILTPAGQGRNDGYWVSQPAVIKEGSAWTMIYSYRNGGVLTGYRYATSSDGISWTKGGTGDILTVAPLYGEYHQLIKISGHYYLIYEAGNDSTNFRIFVADSSSVTGPYTNSRRLFRESNTVGAFDRYHVATPFVFNSNSGWILYYSGAFDHDFPYYTNTWPGGAAVTNLQQITQGGLEYPFASSSQRRSLSVLGTRTGSRQVYAS